MFLLPQFSLEQSVVLRGFAVVTLPLHVVLAPLFWVYVRTLTATQPKVWLPSDRWHFLPSIVACLIPVLAFLVGQQSFMALFDGGRAATSSIQYVAIALIKLLEAIIILQVMAYSIIIVRRLRAYRQALTQVFASKENIELRWLTTLAIVLVVYIVISAASTIMQDPFFYEPWESMVDITVLWFVIVWGLRQKPGLLSEQVESANVEELLDTRYENSGLSAEQAKQIAQKLTQAMTADKLYRDPDLTLSTLASHLNTLPNYVSQALNQTLGESFFDYVNKWRVEDAKCMLSESKHTVLAIAEEVGFNSRSSFYNAFKRFAGETPTRYRQKQTVTD